MPFRLECFTVYHPKNPWSLVIFQRQNRERKTLPSLICHGQKYDLEMDLTARNCPECGGIDQEIINLLINGNQVYEIPTLFWIKHFMLCLFSVKIRKLQNVINYFELIALTKLILFIDWSSNASGTITTAKMWTGRYTGLFAKWSSSIVWDRLIDTIFSFP